MFKRDTNVYLQVSGGDYYQLPVYPDAAFSQVYSEEELPQKTLHNPEKLVSSGFTSSLNPGNFNFTFGLIDSVNAFAVLQCMCDRNPSAHTLYLENEGVVIRLNSCVIQSAVFNLQQDAISTVTMSGSYADSDYSTLPGSEEILGEAYTYIQGLVITRGISIIPNITSLNFELSNDVTWLINKTMHDTAPVSRSDFTVSGKTLSGTVVSNSSITLPEYYDNEPFRIEVIFGGSNILEIYLPESIVVKEIN